MRCVVVCGGSVKDYSSLRKYFEAADLIICVDGGACHLRNLNIVPDILIGDFDSISAEDYAAFANAGAETVRFPREKDATDTELALELAVERGCRSIVMLGALGTRLDHSLANVFLLKRLLASGVKGIIADEHNEVELIDKSICIKRENGVKVSLLPVCGAVTGVTTSGLYYPLADATVEFGSTWGVSNEFSGDTAYVTIKDGLLLVIKSQD